MAACSPAHRWKRLVHKEPGQETAGCVVLGHDIHQAHVSCSTHEHEHWWEGNPTSAREETQCWIKAYAHGLQRVGEAVDGWHWAPNGTSFLPTMSSLVKVFVGSLNTDVRRGSTVGCWLDPPTEVPQQAVRTLCNSDHVP